MNTYIKSPMNYIGGKYKLLPQILPHFPTNINHFVDLFAGGCNVSINVAANKITCNDINSKLIEMFIAFQQTKLSDIIAHIERRIDEYKLSKENERGFKSYREFYNQTKNPLDLYALMCYSYNYQMRFNNDMDYNSSFGRGRSCFSFNMRQNLINFVTQLQKMTVEFTNLDFREFDIDGLSDSDFIYCDPPYIISTGSYNDGNRGFKNWTHEEECALYDYLDNANSKGIKFALSNVLEHKGKTNDMLNDWAQNYQVIDVYSNYSNSSYNTKNGNSREVLITNY